MKGVAPAGYPDENVFDIGDRTWRVTLATGRAHTPIVDDGRTGWKRHAVDASGKSACGMKPGRWGGDLFEDDMPVCARCAVALGACKACAGSRRTRVRGSDRDSGPCETCRASGVAAPPRTEGP